MTSGVGGAQLSLLYVDSNGTIKEKIDFSRDNDSGNLQYIGIINMCNDVSYHTYMYM